MNSLSEIPDLLFLSLIEKNVPFFSLKLNYVGEDLTILDIYE